jgi:hypothetical protein
MIVVIYRLIALVDNIFINIVNAKLGVLLSSCPFLV